MRNAEGSFSRRAIAVEVDAEGEGGKWASTYTRRIRDVPRKSEKGAQKRVQGGRGGGSSRGRKRSYDRAFLVASIHVSSVTRVMSVGNTRFLESSGAAFSPSASPFSLLPVERAADFSGALFIIVYIGVYTRVE